VRGLAISFAVTDVDPHVVASKFLIRMVPALKRDNPIWAPPVRPILNFELAVGCSTPLLLRHHNRDENADHNEEGDPILHDDANSGADEARQIPNAQKDIGESHLQRVQPTHPKSCIVVLYPPKVYVFFSIHSMSDRGDRREFIIASGFAIDRSLVIQSSDAAHRAMHLNKAGAGALSLCQGEKSDAAGRQT
jgi:hypothetical protein